MADFTNLQAEIDQVKAAVAANTTVSASAVTLINSQADLTKAAVTKALQENDAADQSSINDAMAAIDAVRTQLVSDSAGLGAAVTANTPAAP